jgi:hypothetical protein
MKQSPGPHDGRPIRRTYSTGMVARSAATDPRTRGNDAGPSRGQHRAEHHPAPPRPDDPAPPGQRGHHVLPGGDPRWHQRGQHAGGCGRHPQDQALGEHDPPQVRRRGPGRGDDRELAPPPAGAYRERRSGQQDDLQQREPADEHGGAERGATGAVKLGIALGRARRVGEDVPGHRHHAVGIELLDLRPGQRAGRGHQPFLRRPRILLIVPGRCRPHDDRGGLEIGRVLDDAHHAIAAWAAVRTARAPGRSPMALLPGGRRASSRSTVGLGAVGDPPPALPVPLGLGGRPGSAGPEMSSVVSWCTGRSSGQMITAWAAPIRRSARSPGSAGRSAG